MIIINKIFALALYKKGSYCYCFLHHHFNLSSKNTSQTITIGIPFETGINGKLFEKLVHRVQKLSFFDRHCILMVDGISLACDYTYDISEDKFVGHVDLGSFGRRNELADPALVFMINGLKEL